MLKRNNMKEQITVTIDKDIIKKVKEIAQEYRFTTSALIDIILNSWLYNFKEGDVIEIENIIVKKK